MKEKITVLLLVLVSMSLSAQSLLGPESPCVTCDQLNAKTEPFNGTWYNPDQSGTGMSIDVQNGVLFGIYYGYTEQGKQLWLTFTGALVASDEANIMWTFEADLAQFENGNGFNQDYVFPTATDYQAKINLKFTQKNHALISINDGQEQNIVPFIFGEATSADFPEQTSYLLPDLDGVWSFVYKLKEDANGAFPNQWSYVANNFRMTNKAIVNRDGKYWILYDVAIYGPPPEILIFADIVCEIDDINAETLVPECVYTDRRGFFEGPDYIVPEFHFPLGGLGAYRLFGETIDGHTFEAIKVDSTDYQSRPMAKYQAQKSQNFSALPGPASPCVYCNLMAETTEPLNGVWYNPEQSGSGFGIDVQNGKVFGIYYGYDEQGQQLWLTFIADLVPSDEENIMWTLDADLNQFENGTSFNSTYQFPTATDYSGQIHVKFTQKNHAIFSVNDGDAQNIVPVVFATQSSVDFPEYSSYQLPELKGMWAATYKINYLVPGPYQSFPNQWGFLPRMFEIGQKTINDDEKGYWVNYDIKAYFDYPNTFDLGQIRCQVADNGLGNSAPDCVYSDNFGILGYPGEPVPEFHFSLGGLGAYRIFGATLDGHTFEAIKIDSKDYDKP